MSSFELLTGLEDFREFEYLFGKMNPEIIKAGMYESNVSMDFSDIWYLAIETALREVFEQNSMSINNSFDVVYDGIDSFIQRHKFVDISEEQEKKFEKLTGFKIN